MRGREKGGNGDKDVHARKVSDAQTHSLYTHREKERDRRMRHGERERERRAATANIRTTADSARDRLEEGANRENIEGRDGHTMESERET